MESADISITLFDTQQWKVMTSALYVQLGKTMDNKYYIYVKTLISLAKWGPGGGGEWGLQ